MSEPIFEVKILVPSWAVKRIYGLLCIHYRDLESVMDVKVSRIFSLLGLTILNVKFFYLGMTKQEHRKLYPELYS